MQGTTACQVGKVTNVLVKGQAHCANKYMPGYFSSRLDDHGVGIYHYHVPGDTVFFSSYSRLSLSVGKYLIEDVWGK